MSKFHNFVTDDGTLNVIESRMQYVLKSIVLKMFFFLFTYVLFCNKSYLNSLLRDDSFEFVNLKKSHNTILRKKEIVYSIIKKCKKKS